MQHYTMAVVNPEEKYAWRWSWIQNVKGWRTYCRRTLKPVQLSMVSIGWEKQVKVKSVLGMLCLHLDRPEPDIIISCILLRHLFTFCLVLVNLMPSRKAPSPFLGSCLSITRSGSSWHLCWSLMYRYFKVIGTCKLRNRDPTFCEKRGPIGTHGRQNRNSNELVCQHLCISQ